jgi:uncharacterized protein with NRDE domain
MCLILLAHKVDPRYPLILAANRDESYARPAAPAAFWDDHPDIFGGRDLEKGGTWLGLTLSGKLAAVTNYREGRKPGAAPLSRGTLVSDFLTGELDAPDYLERVKSRGSQFNGFILIAGNLDALYWYSNRAQAVQEIAPGVHGLSNHLFNSSWPKVTRSKQALEALLGASEAGLAAGLFEILSDRREAPDDELPDTGVGLQRERELSANFICGEHYGTRASTVVLIGAEGDTLFIERSYGVGGKPLGEVARRFRLTRLIRPLPAAGQAARQA